MVAEHLFKSLTISENGDFLGYGCLLQITNDTPGRFILYRNVGI